MFFNTIIKGTGHFLPSVVVKNSDFLESSFFDQNGKPFEIPNKEIISKFEEITEIKERRYVDTHQSNSDMALIASNIAIKEWGGDKEIIDYIIYAHNFGEITVNGNVDIVPSLSSRLKNKLAIKNRKCINYDMIFGCPGWLEGFILAHKLIQARQAKVILVVASEILSRAIDPFDRDGMIFSDGAGAAIICGDKYKEKRGVLASGTFCDSFEGIDYLSSDKSLNKDYENKKLHVRMQGRKIYEYALNNVPKAIQDTIDLSGLTLKDFKKLLVHQANAKMDEAILKRLLKLYNVNRDELNRDFMPMTIHNFGNSSVATVPTMLDLILKDNLHPHKILEGDNILFASVGAGMNINAIAYKF